MKKFFYAFMTLTMAANVAGFIVALDEQLDFLTWEGLRGWNMFGASMLGLVTWIPVMYALWLAVKKIKERRSKRYLTKQVMYLL